MNCDCNCNCDCSYVRQIVKVKLKLDGFEWEDSVSYDPAMAAKCYVEDIIEKGKINIANGNTIVVETELDGINKCFIVERRDVPMFYVREV